MTTVYLVPSVLAPDAIETIPAYVLDAVKKCQVIFAENERTARRFLKSLDRSIVIDDFKWFAIHKAENDQVNQFRKKVQENNNIAIISEAGCPGVADPGQVLVQAAQEMNCIIRPLVGPSSILLALMASGMNGQHFEFAGYLPIDNTERAKKLKELEINSARQNSTKIFIETPYRNNQLLDSIITNCNGETKLCIASNITAPAEQIVTRSISYWKKNKPELHKQPAIFLLFAGNSHQ